jgi:hypothetical protein
MFFADMAGVAWAIGWVILSVWIILSMIVFALYIICKLIEFIRKELE